MSEPKRNKDGLDEQQYLAGYDAGKYPRPSVTVDILAFTVTDEQPNNYRKLPQKELRLLLVRRGEHPFLGQWALPGGFVHMDEGLDAAARRELREETNVDGVYMEQLYTFGEVDRDPRTRVISTAYLALVDSARLGVRAGDDASDARWFSVTVKPYSSQKTRVAKDTIVEEWCHDLTLDDGTERLTAQVRTVSHIRGRTTTVERRVESCGGIAFDHAAIVLCAVERLRNKIEYTDIAFELMPDLFTLTQLQQVYEIILGKELLKANFRRKTAGMVLETDGYTGDAGHRPSRLYRYNPGWKRNEQEGLQ